MATILTDDFNSYADDSNLVGQGAWTNLGTEQFTVENDVVFEGAEAVRAVNNGGTNALKGTGTARADGKQTIYMRVDQTNAECTIKLGTATDQDDGGMIVRFNSDASVFFVSAFASQTLLATYLANTWYCVEIEWRDVDNKIRYRITKDGDAFGDWNDNSGAWWAGSYNDDPGTASCVYLDYRGSGYFDYVAEEPYIEATTSSSSSSSTSSSSQTTSSSSSSSSSSSTSSSTSQTTSSSSSTSSSSVSNTTSSSSSSTIVENKIYTRGSYTSLPLTNVDLTTPFSLQDYTDVSLNDATRVDIISNQYAIKQFKDKNINNTDEIHVTWNGQSDLAPTSSDVVLQIWDDNAKSWETLDTENLANDNEDFDLIGDKTENLSNYYADQNWTTCRVYQLNV